MGPVEFAMLSFFFSKTVNCVETTHRLFAMFLMSVPAILVKHAKHQGRITKRSVLPYLERGPGFATAAGAGVYPAFHIPELCLPDPWCVKYLQRLRPTADTSIAYCSCLWNWGGVFFHRVLTSWVR